MDYMPKFINNMTIEELKTEKEGMYNNDYRYGCGIDKPRLWDINHTIKVLESKLN